MYPIDLLKVENLFKWPCSHPNHSTADSDASRKPITYRSLHRHFKCYGHNITRRRLSHIMEGGIQRGSRSWWVMISRFRSISV